MSNKKLIIGLLWLLGFMGLQAEAQNGFNLPYSQYGLGICELPYNMPMVARMGGVVYTRSGNNYINPFNPASYGSIATESFVFDIGFNLQRCQLNSGELSVKDADGNVGYLAVGMPIAKWLKLSIGLMPYSTIDYLTVVNTTNINGKSIRTEATGDGGVNEVYAGFGFNIIENKKNNLQAGFNIGYLTGKIVKLLSYSSTDSNFVPERKAKDMRLGNVVLDFGIQYRRALGEKYTLGVGLSYKPHMKLRPKEIDIIYTYYASTESLLDTIFPERGDDVETRSLLEQANTVGVGLSLERNGQWQLAADATFGSWQGLRYSEPEGRAIFGETIMHSGAYSSYALGFEKMVNMDASNYWSRMGWSLGAHLVQGLVYVSTTNGDKRIDQWGVGGGLNLPMRRGRSLLTISVAYSSMGKKDIMQRNCITFGIAISSCERWFVKRKYN